MDPRLRGDDRARVANTAQIANKAQIANGFSLLEVMIALAISTSCLMTILTLYVASEKNLQTQLSLRDEVSRVQAVSEIISREVHEAGDMGCGKVNQYSHLFSHLAVEMTPDNKLTGNDHELTVIHADDKSANIIAESDDHLMLTSDENVRFNANEALIVSDCLKAEIFQPTMIKISDHQQVMQLSSPLTYAFGSQAEIRKLEVNQFFVASENDSKISAFYKRNDREKIALVEGINQIQFLYSIIRNNKLVNLPANEISDWAEVKGLMAIINVAHEKNNKNWQLYASL